MSTAIANDQIVSLAASKLTGTLAVTRGGTGLWSATSGDLFYASAADVLSRRAIGSTNDVLTVSGGLPVWAAPAAAGASVIVNDTTTNATMFPVWVTANTGSLPLKVSSTKLSCNPSTGALSAVGLLASSAVLDGASDANPFEVIGSYTGVLATHVLGTYTSFGDVARHLLRRANGTAGSPTAVASGDTLGIFIFRGRDSTGFNANNDGAVRALATENFTSTAHGTKVEFLVTPAGTVTQVIGLTLEQNSVLTLAAPARLKGYTVATLPAGIVGYMAYATDLLAPTFFAVAVGGGAITGPVFYDGTNWKAV